jgi:DNA-binding transcriptional MocR family regulator
MTQAQPEPERSAPLYEKVASRIARLIETGALRPGDRVPSLREVSRQQRVSLSTSLQAYGLLESRGLLEARPQSGFFVRPRLPAQPQVPRTSSVPAATTRVDLASVFATLMRAAHDPALVPLGAAAPAPSLLPGRRLDRMIGPILRRHPGHDAYSPAQGMPELRREIARRAVDWGALLSPDELVTTCGGTEALHLALRAVTRPGDTVAVESPAYFGVLLLLQSLGLKAVEVETEPAAGIGVEALETALRRHRIRACVASFNCHNPLGFVASEERKRAVVELLARHEVPLIEDHVYGDLGFDEKACGPAKAFDRHGLVLLCASYSKVLSPGYRVGWIAGGRFHARILELKFTSTLATPTLPQLAVAAFLRGGGYDRHLRRMRAACREQVGRMRDAVGRHFPEGTRVTNPAGGFLLWIEAPAAVDTLQLFDEALRAGITITPGPVFSARLALRNCLRLNCSHPWSERIERAITTLGRLVAAHTAGSSRSAS